MQRQVLVTGATGFVGSRVVSTLARDPGLRVLAGVRKTPPALAQGVHAFMMPSLEQSDFQASLQGIDYVVHCAARVHVMNDQSTDPLSDYRKINVEGTLALARRAAQDGVKRFVFLSSIKVNGETTNHRAPYTADEVPTPVDPYGISKLEAERALLALAQSTGMEVVIVRPVLVYGPHVKANFQSMMKWLKAGVPLPLGAIKNKRSMVALDNLVDLIRVCLIHPAAAGQVFLASDDQDLSTTELLKKTSTALGVSAKLLPVPAGLIKTAASLVRRPGIAARLCDSLQVDIIKTKRLLEWTPPLSVDQALKLTAHAYLESER